MTLVIIIELSLGILGFVFKDNLVRTLIAHNDLKNASRIFRSIMLLTVFRRLFNNTKVTMQLKLSTYFKKG